MKKSKLLAFAGLTLAFLCFLPNCASYHPNTKIPVSERVLLELGNGLTLRGIDRSFWGGHVKNRYIFPSGTQELTFDYEIWEETGRSTSGSTTTTYYNVHEASFINISHTFEAGHHYRVVAYRRSGDQIELEIIDLGNKTVAFHKGVYTGTHRTMEMYLGSGAQSYGMAGLGFGGGTTFDFWTPITLSLNGGVDFGLGPGEEETSSVSMAFGGYAGFFGHLYIPHTNFAIGAGYGYRAEITLMSPYDPFYSPFIRGELLYDEMGLYFEYYTSPSYLNTFDEPRTRYADTFKRWGVGFFGRLK